MDWQVIATAPFELDLELAVIDSEGPHSLVFPCRRVAGGWQNSKSQEHVDVNPTHWRAWRR